MLKSLFGKTFDAAKQSAHQMYGDDLPELSTLLADPEDEHEEEPGKRQYNQQDFQTGGEKGVRFERSIESRNQGRENGTSPTLQSLRKYAVGQDPDKENTPLNETSEQEQPALKRDKKTDSTPSSFKNENYYSRANIRARQDPGKEESTKDNESGDIATKRVERNDKEKTDKEFSLPEAAPFNGFEAPKAKKKPKKVITPSSGQEIEALQERFNKLESMLQTVLEASNMNYASHPAFQKLLHTGIKKKIINGWFEDIIGQGVDPYEQTELFMSELTGIIREAMGSNATRKPEKHLVFIGKPGSGKTNLVMKLAQHPDFMGARDVGIVSVIPQGNDGTPYYTILEPFCRDHGLPYCQVKDAAQVKQLQEKWKEFDHLLIDTPSLEKEGKAMKEQYKEIKNVLMPLSGLETHCLIDASGNGFSAPGASAPFHRLDVDYLALSHLDLTSQWGPVIPLLQQAEVPVRYISVGQDVPRGIRNFDPKWVTKQMLENS
ncbi:hypothetical protein NC796_24020 [Aliifodinibius sp. S!AR15-10]|uniref:hypothetical protein n=1 Tax=Aliifodinibius sp. S!AR15-10 TaxID=2950437 RepID=UPI00285BE4CF|nr:hypothetical protein [Aliifodinibius sp. S!AR15-10]MDR8394237.1 hypothetical protein [Aliifodinibius sp. S!AR15-10]